MPLRNLLKKGYLFCCLSLVIGLSATPWVIAAETPPVPSDAASVAPVAEDDPPSAVFVSGTIRKWNPETKALSLETYLNEKGNPAKELIDVILTPKTEILGSDALIASPEVREGQDVDAEFDPVTRQASYLYIYS